MRRRMFSATPLKPFWDALSDDEKKAIVDANGVSGVIVLPMLGENATLTQAERDGVLSAAKEAIAGRVPLLSGLAELSTDDAIAAARNYQKLGAQGLMTFPSLAYRTDRRETVEWYKAVAAARA